MSYRHLVVDTEGNGMARLREVGIVPIERDADGAYHPGDGILHAVLDATVGSGWEDDHDAEALYELRLYLDRQARGHERLVFWSDNPAFDWQPLDRLLRSEGGKNPFGWSARRIGDLYAGLVRNPRHESRWKERRITPHTHHPVDDALGNAEALCSILNEWRLEL